MSGHKTSQLTSAWWAGLGDFGDLLRRKREELGLSQAQMAQMIGVHQSRISRIERGQGKPKDKPSVIAYARFYRLNREQTAAWLEFLFGPTIGLQELNYNTDAFRLRLFDQTELLVDKAQAAWRVHTTPDSYEYFASLRHFHHDSEPHELLDELDAIMPHVFEIRRGHIREALLAELGATFIHYLNVQGRYHDHLTLALSAADAAARLGRTVIEGWLRADSIPWAQMEHYGDPVSAQAHLERAQQIAAILKNKDLAALSFAFQARASLFRGDLRQAHFYLSQAQSLSCSPAIQVRIYWVAGEVAASKRQFARAIDYYEDALKTERRSFGDQTVTVHATFLLGEIYTLTREFALAHEYLSNPLCDQGVNRRKLSPAREAYAKLGLARVAINQGDLLAARDHVWEADRLMATQEPTPRLKRLLMRTQTELSTIYTARSN